jgi:molybdopterin molybdotransferase
MPRESPFTFAFPSPAAALAALLAHIRPVETESIPLNDSPGRILAQSITADRPSPSVDVSSMDGYAVRLADLTTTELRVAGEVRIGREPPALPDRSCLRIVTGGGIPSGADAVIKREEVTEHPDRIILPRTLRIQSGQNIRRAGENLASGAQVAPTGARITPAIGSALAAFGIARPRVYRRIVIAALTNGDELVPSDAHPTPWQLRDSNAAALRALFQPLPFADVRHTHIPDEAAAMHTAIADALVCADALILTGGVSMGHRDFVADALGANHVNIVFHGLPQRPGKPILGGIVPGAGGGVRPVLALPGNPVSVMVTARRIALPAILARAGVHGTGVPPACPGSLPSLIHLTNPDAKSTDLWWHRLAKLTAPGQAELVDAKSSGDLVGAAVADGFVELPPHQTGPGPWPFYAWNI